MKTALVVCLLTAFAAAEAPSVEKLLADLEDPNYQVRRKAVLAVEGRKEPELLEKLLVMAADDPHPNIRGYVADSLTSFRDPRVFGVLAKIAVEEEIGPRQHAYVALGRLGDPACRKILQNGLTGYAGAGAYAAKGLGLLGDPEDFPVVADFFLARQANAYVAELVPEALGRIGDDRAIPTLIPPLGDETFVAAADRISAVWEFPYNVHTHGVAVWAILRLRDREEPFDLDELTAFATKKPPERIAGDVKAIRKWWAKRR